MRASASQEVMSLRLSICLPVYNFGAFLGETLDSILPQALLGTVEVVVIDGASTDDTADVVTRRMAQWPQLRYVRLARRGGIDVDMALGVEEARAQWCWLFSGDDVMRDGAVGRALSLLDAGDDVLICRHADCDKQMRFPSERPVTRPDNMRRLDFGNEDQRRAFLQDALTTEALFSFMSALVIRRAVWMSVPAVGEFTGSCWGHVARLLTIAARQLRVCYVAETWLDKRAENDSFL
jgi:abequosyltransferase